MDSIGEVWLMLRALQHQYPEAVYHVMARGDGGKAILGIKTLATMATFGSGTGELQYNPSGDGTTYVDIAGATEGVSEDYTLTTYSAETFISGVDVNGHTVLAMTSAIPEPTSMSLLAIGRIALLRRRRKA